MAGMSEALDRYSVPNGSASQQAYFLFEGESVQQGLHSFTVFHWKCSFPSLYS